MFPYTTDVMAEYPYVVQCISETESDQWEKWRWLCKSQKLNWEEDFIALHSPILASSRRSLYDRWAFKDAKHALMFSLKWS
jgi:hypothetical protein